MISRVCREANIDLTLVQVTRKRFWTRLSQRKQSQRMSLRRVSDQPLLSEKTVVEEVQEEKMTIAKSTVANDAAEKGTSQHGVVVNAQPEVLNHLRERVSETDEFSTAWRQCS